jgi:hypothetical protein
VFILYPLILHVFKIGFSDNLNNIISSIQTANVENIIIYNSFYTKHYVLLESIVHKLLDDLRINKREQLNILGLVLTSK